MIEPFAKVRQIIAGKEDGVLVPAQVSRSTHAIKQETEAALTRFSGIVRCLARVEAQVGRPAPIKFGEKRPEPVGMLVVNRDQ